MKKIFTSIGTGILNGFPMIQSIVRNVKGVKKSTNETDQKESFNVVSLLTELSVVVLIIAFVTGKITVQDLEKVVSIIKNL